MSARSRVKVSVTVRKVSVRSLDLRDDAAEDAAVFVREEAHAEVGADHATGIGDVFEEVIEVGTARAGQIGADLAALAVHDVAGTADGGEEHAALAQVGFGERGA
jgi:hypothetical protein